MTKRIEPSSQSEVPPISDPAVLAEFKLAMPPFSLEAHLTALVSWYGAAEVKRTIAKITTGATEKTDDKFQTWMAVKVFRFRNPGASVKDACCKLSEFAQKYDRRLGKNGGIKGGYVISRKPETIRRIYTGINTRFKREPHLRAAWQWLLDSACGGQTAPVDWRANGNEALQIAIREFHGVSEK